LGRLRASSLSLHITTLEPIILTQFFNHSVVVLHIQVEGLREPIWERKPSVNRWKMAPFVVCFFGGKSF
jgi:hypothetical protein